MQHAPSPTIDKSTNPWTELLYNRKKPPPNITTKPKPDLLRQFQPRHTLINVGTNFRAQAAQIIVAQHVFNLTYDFHIYNKQGKKE